MERRGWWHVKIYHEVEAEFYGTEVPVKPVDFHDEPHTGQE